MLDIDIFISASSVFLLHPKHFPLLGPVFGEAFAELGNGECGGFFAIQYVDY